MPPSGCSGSVAARALRNFINSTQAERKPTHASRATTSQAIDSASGSFEDPKQNTWNQADNGYIVSTYIVSEEMMAHLAIEETASSIRAWRTRIGLDRAEAAEALGISYPTYKSLENGAREVKPYHARLAALIEATRERPMPVTHSDVHVIGGGTFSRVRHHFSLCAEAFGTTAEELAASCGRRGRPAVVHLTRMADRASPLVTSEDVGGLVDRLVADPGVRVLFMNAALCDFDGQIADVPSGKYASRLRSRDGQQSMVLTPAEAAELPSWSSPLAVRLLPTAQSGSFRDMPPGWSGLPLAPHPGAFGPVRSRHVHEGVDLYCAEGTAVTAVEPGVVVAIEDFTGSRATPPSPWWLETRAILVEGLSGVVLYGELEPSPELAIGHRLERGQVIGHVVRVLRHDKGRPLSMLHLELHAHGTTKSSPWDLGKPQPQGLRDPTALLMMAARD
jgi:DNA-binding XRE family transcriptional regulator